MIPPAQPPRFAALGQPAPVRVKIGSVRWEIRSAAVEQTLRDVLSQPDDYVRCQGSVIHETWLVTVARIPLPALPQGCWLLRKSNYAKPSARKRDFFRPAAAVRAFRASIALEAAGLPTPRVLAAGVLRVLQVPRTGYLILEEVSGAVSLATLAQSPAGAARAAVQTVARTIASLHELGFIHGDLTINNVLLDAAARPWFIDLERTRRVRGAVNWRQAVEDVHRFARHFRTFSPAGRAGALRLLLEYCAARGWVGRERDFVQALAQRLKHKIEGDLKS